MASPSAQAAGRRAPNPPTQDSPRFPYTLSVVFPAYNEEGNLETTVGSALGLLPGLVREFEIVVVDDGSRDRTPEIADRLSSTHPAVRAVHHPENRGYGAALATGFRAATKDLVFFADSDGQFDLGELPRLLEWADRYDIVIGYRHNRRDPLHRRLNALGWNTLVDLLLGIRVRDINCAFKLFHRRVLDSMSIRSHGALINTEVLARARRLGFTIQEVPVTHLPRRTGQQTGARPHVVLKAFRELFALYGDIRRNPGNAAPGRSSDALRGGMN